MIGALFLYWGVLLSGGLDQITGFFQGYTLGLFLLVLIAYYFIFRLPEKSSIVFGLIFTFLIFALSLAYKWRFAYSDNFMIGGLLPYKDAKNFYLGANLILEGFQLKAANQATERPLFPGFLSSLLLLTGRNLKLSLAILVQIAGISLYHSSRRVLRSFGVIPASIYITLLFFYIQPWLGYTMSEVFGFTAGCLAFSSLLMASSSKKWIDVVLGGILLVIAVSARAGTFLVFPVIIAWVGWLFRGSERFSWRAFLYACLFFAVTYFLVNSMYSRLLGVPDGASFGNFSYALYGQVRGGTGWHSAIEDLGTRKPEVVYRAAYDFFHRHPLSLFIGFAKSYRDFFLPGHPNIFPFDRSGQPTWITYILWVFTMLLLGAGLYKLVKKLSMNVSSFLLAGFVGIIISIPFLPPIDGGARFYASTTPFFFVVPAIGFSKMSAWKENIQIGKVSRLIVHSSSGILILSTIVIPVFVSLSQKHSSSALFSCPSEQEAYKIRVAPDSYLDLIQSDESSCGVTPNICLQDLRVDNVEFSTDDFYQEIYSLAEETKTKKRVIPAVNLLDEKFHYFFIDSNRGRSPGSKDISGCSSEILTKNQSIFVIETILVGE